MILLSEYMTSRLRGKKFIGAGGTRSVYDLGNGSVLKAAKSRVGIQCNRMEVNLYQSTSWPLRKYLARIIDYDKEYRWLIMKKYDRKFPNTPEYRRKLKLVIGKFMSQGILPSKGVRRYVRPYAPNMRLKRNKQIVIIDYGGFKYR